MSDSVRPHRWQPTRLPHPWGSPGKNTGVGCHFLLHYEVQWSVRCSVMSDSFQPCGLKPTWLLCPWDSPGKNTGRKGGGSHYLLQGIFPTQGSNRSSHCRYIAKLLQSCSTLCDPIDGSPPQSPIPGVLQARTLEWVAISFSSA